jgi:DNA-binding LacI/PurR family transcriptional regulator
MQNPRIKDIAALAGVSTATVSHVINKTRFVVEETKRKVLEAIEKTGYTPNMHARNLASGSSRTLGLIISDIVNPFFPDLVKAIQERALEPGFEIIVTNTDYESGHEVSCVQRLLESRVRGIMVMTTETDGAAVKRLEASGIPTVFLDIGKVGPKISNIRVDYAGGMRSALEHLLSLGHRRIAFISGPRQFMSAELRRNAFAKFMKQNRSRFGVEAVLFEGDFKMESGQRAIAAAFQNGSQPTAVIAANDLMAFGALRELKERGVRVPDDISLVGCDDVWLASLTEPPLTTIAIPRAKIGRSAVEAVVDGRNASGREVKISTELIVRGSTGPARTK